MNQRTLASSPVTPLFWKRYVDDVISAVSKTEVENLLNHLNSVEPSIQFTVERENDGQLSFLDLNIYRKDQGLLETTPFSGRIQKYPKGFQTFPNDIQICHVNFRYFQMIIRNVQRDFRPFQMIFRFVMWISDISKW